MTLLPLRLRHRLLLLPRLLLLRLLTLPLRLLRPRLLPLRLPLPPTLPLRPLRPRLRLLRLLPLPSNLVLLDKKADLRVGFLFVHRIDHTISIQSKPASWHAQLSATLPSPITLVIAAIASSGVLFLRLRCAATTVFNLLLSIAARMSALA